MASHLLQHEREAIAALSRSLAPEGLVAGTSGNVSADVGDRVAITPTGAALAELEPEQVTVLDLSATVGDGRLSPTSELDLDLGVYERYGAGAVVHTHAVATALSYVVNEVPCVEEIRITAAGDYDIDRARRVAGGG